MYGRHSTEIIGYTYHADIYCAHCGNDLPEIDPEGNWKHPIFLDQQWEVNGYRCGKCNEPGQGW